MGELSIHRWKGFELYPVINKKTVAYNFRRYAFWERQSPANNLWVLNPY
jgi:hypothetical protein